MSKITFMGAGSTVFAKNVLGDAMLTPSLSDSEIALYDIDADRLAESTAMIETLNRNINNNRATIKAYHGVQNRKKALANSNFVVNSIQVGGYKPSTVIDFEIPKKFGLQQTIGDTLGIGGIFRGLRTIPVVLDFARDMEAVCPDALFLNYVNPMAIITGAMQRVSPVKTVGLCHSVQGCAQWLLDQIGFDTADMTKYSWKIAGINHMAWLLDISKNGKDFYPEIKKRAAQKLAQWRKKGATKNNDMVRLQMMLHFGHYITESSEHNAEYTPYWIKRNYPGLIEEFNIPIDEYPRRCINQIKDWKKRAKEMVGKKDLTHTRTHEYASYIMNAIVTNEAYEIGGNVQNTNLITNLPAKACVEVPCLVNRNGVQPCFVGELPEQCAALNRTNINVQLLTIEAALTKKRETLYQAAMLDPHTSSELSLDKIVEMCDKLIEAHGSYLPKFK